LSPQQVQSEDVDRRADIFAAGVVLWESIVGRKLLARGDATITRVTGWQGIPDDDLALVPAFVQPIVKRALARDPAERYATAREMAMALADAVPPASSMEVGDWVEQRAHQILADRARALSDVERQTTASDVRPAFQSGFPRHSSSDETRTALSSADLVPSAPGEPKKRKRLAAIITASAAVLLLLVWMLKHGSPPAPPVAAAPAPPVAAAPAPPVAAAPVLSPAALAPEPSVVPAPSSAPTRAKRALASTAKAPAPAAKKNCTPPFDIGKDGIKHFKPECFK
jgi:serine/threonine-protein kinase